MTDIIAPFNGEAEQALIGATMLNPASFSSIDVRAKDFYIEKHRWIWQAMAQLHSAGVEPDFITLCERVKENGHLAEIGGEAFLVGLINMVPSMLHAAEYAGIVKDKAKRRRMLMIAQNIASAALDEESNPDDAMSSVIDKATDLVKTDHDMLHIRQVIPDLIDQVSDAYANPKDTWGIQTGFVDLDRLTGGVCDLWYLAGPPGIGKSKLMLSIIKNAASGKNGVACAIFSLEMSAIMNVRRAVSAHAKIDTRKLKTGQMSAEEFELFFKACEEMAELPIYICDQPMLTPSQLYSHLVRLKAKVDLKLFGLDYMYLMDDESNLGPIERTELLSGKMKTIQRSVDVASINVNSVTKKGMEGKTDITDIRGSGQLPHDADVVITMNYSNPNVKNIITLNLRKGRDIDMVGAVELLATSGFPTFESLQPRDIDQEKVPQFWVPEEDKIP